eukprot:TRINITY_DN4389_c0_g1_i14.p1 TRINITY_DN4389_c0_g1~~TRINITY_DN4389_c0_g1_i14.p1  ORF type:complete len:266 (-),score=35.38 TRINITY_DN4389_c0_g1_i14:189-986(-)
MAQEGFEYVPRRDKDGHMSFSNMKFTGDLSRQKYNQRVEALKKAGGTPVSECCCGCHMPLGVNLVLTYNLAQSLYYIGAAIAGMVWEKGPYAGSDNYEHQILYACMGILSIPFIVAGYQGVAHYEETSLRPFVYYLAFELLVEVAVYILPLIIYGTCWAVPDVLKYGGAAATCGFLRVFIFIFLIQLLSIQAYCLFMVWSLCEDMKHGVGSPYDELLAHKVESHALETSRLGHALHGGKNHGIIYGTTKELNPPVLIIKPYDLEA